MVQWPSGFPAESGDNPATDKWDEVDICRDAWLESDRCTRRDIQAQAVCCSSVECERRVRLGKVIVRADLDRPVASILDA
ncbi:MAG: hypothetical protein ACJA14_001252 [Ilumatobacter sp.]